MDSRSNFRQFLVLFVCEGVIFAGLGENKIYKYKTQNFIPIMEFITIQNRCLNANLPRFSCHFSFQGNLAEKSIFSIFETISGFFSSLQMYSNKYLQISKIHDNFSLDPFLAQEVTRETLSLGPEKPKFSKCSVSNQILVEGCICLEWLLNGLISSRKTI